MKQGRERRWHCSHYIHSGKLLLINFVSRFIRCSWYPMSMMASQSLSRWLCDVSSQKQQWFQHRTCETPHYRTYTARLQITFRKHYKLMILMHPIKVSNCPSMGYGQHVVLNLSTIWPQIAKTDASTYICRSTNWYQAGWTCVLMCRTHCLE